MSARLTKRTAQGLAWSLSTLLTRTILSIVSVAVLARLLSPHDYGVMSAAAIIVAFGTMLSGLGLGPALVQHQALTKAHVSAAIVLGVSVATVFSSIQWFCAPIIAKFMKVEELEFVTRVLSGTIVAQSLNTLFVAILSRNLKFKAISLINLGSWSIATFGIAIPLAYFQFSYWSLVAGTVAQTAISLVCFSFAARTSICVTLTLQATKELLSKSLGFSVTQIMNYIASYADSTIVARTLGAAELGIYSRAFHLVAIPATMFGEANRMVVFPAMSHIHTDAERLKRAYLKGLTLSATTAIPTSAFLMLFSPELIEIILGEQWADAAMPFAIFAASIYFRIGTKTCATILLAKGLPTPLALLQSLYACLVVAGTLMAATFGLNAVCLAVLAAAGASFVAYAWICGHSAGINIGEFTAAHLRPIGAALLVVLIGYFIKVTFLGFPVYIPLLVAIFATGLPMLAALYLKPSLIMGEHGVEVLTLILKPFAKKIG